jgi:bacterioferritin
MSKEEPETKGHKARSIYKCAYPAPYPEVRVARPNKEYAYLLLEDYVGMVSELTAICQYSYHHFVLEDENREVADTLSCIALVEMHHLEILAETIVMLGVDPRYRTVEKNKNERYWDGSFVFYGTALCDRLTADVGSEWAAIANYRKHQRMIDDPYINRILERIILDELHHVEMFNHLIQKYCRPKLPRYNP